MEDFNKLFDSFNRMKIGVLGDVMLDTYVWGNVERISPEAPVPIVSLKRKEHRIGGAANVAWNCRALGANVSILSVIGEDEDGDFLEQLLNEHEINTDHLLKTSTRITTSKTRIISRNQQMMRLDSEITGDLDPASETALVEQVERFIKKNDPDIIIFEDYNKGVITEKIINEVIALCRDRGILTAVDPKRKNFFSYRGADIFKPNLKEVREGLNILFDDINPILLKAIHEELQKILKHEISFITLSDKGVFYQQESRNALIPSHLRSIADVSGAGDTVIAVAAMVFAATKNVHLMAEIANIAGGLVCEHVGTVAVNREELLHECELLLS
jgi:rfaE bifunctional protein kinase chain/domain